MLASISFPSYEFKESTRNTILSRIFYLSRPLEDGLSSQICSFSICTNMTLDQDVNYTSLNPAPFDILGCPPLISAPLGEGRRWRRRKKILFFLQKLLFSPLFFALWLGGSGWSVCRDEIKYLRRISWKQNLKTTCSRQFCLPDLIESYEVCESKSVRTSR